MNDLEVIINHYKNNEYQNDKVWITFTKKTDEHKILKMHRDYIEDNQLGFGDRAFHYMWFLLISFLSKKKKNFRALEIGIYKGQVISLWSLLSKTFNLKMEIDAISPFEGNMNASQIINNKLVNTLRRFFFIKFRTNEDAGNLYLKENYIKIIQDLFSYFDLDFNEITRYHGYSNDAHIVKKVKENRYDLIYIDGDHRFEAVTEDILNYSSLINNGGLLVMDDASFFLPGSKFWKGHIYVSKASQIIEGLGFNNILNVGHNRIYQKICKTHN